MGLTLLEVCSKYAADNTSGAFLDDLRCAIATVCFVIVCLDAILYFLQTNAAMEMVTIYELGFFILRTNSDQTVSRMMAGKHGRRRRGIMRV